MVNMASSSKSHDVEPLRIRKFEVGDLVFAKLKGYPPWPSKINQIENLISGGKETIRYNVYFYGTHQSSILRSSSLYHYDSHAKAIVEKFGRKPKFLKALKELEREMMDKISYLNQLRTPETPWCHGFSNICDSLANDIDVAQERVKSKNHCKPKETEVEEVIDDSDVECIDESRKCGYEVMYVERIPLPDTPENLIILSLNFNKDWVTEESLRIKEEERMMNCHVRIEPFPAKYAHLDPNQRNIVNVAQTSSQQHDSKSKSNEIVKKEKVEPPQETVYSDSDLEEAVETCPVCRLCFFSQDDLKDHEKSVHGSVSTAESMFDNLLNGDRASSKNQRFSWKEGYPMDSIIGNRI
ncbi:hepatoma-derived growth factor-related protein 2-like [Thrips palmi]|uniref:Hepatoma-derived growth factor-related protein 2-like n=1 Tax=Thrips palmi TaxID=161013 RepID=A0A6P8YTR0_THRPL|nr:hepatoma-derived growth factor-related protein 2-like [Thrips palmi]